MPRKWDRTNERACPRFAGKVCFGQCWYSGWARWLTGPGRRDFTKPIQSGRSWTETRQQPPTAQSTRKGEESTHSCHIAHRILILSFVFYLAATACLHGCTPISIHLPGAIVFLTVGFPFPVLAGSMFLLCWVPSTLLSQLTHLCCPCGVLYALYPYSAFSLIHKARSFQHPKGEDFKKRVLNPKFKEWLIICISIIKRENVYLKGSLNEKGDNKASENDGSFCVRAIELTRVLKESHQTKHEGRRANRLCFPPGQSQV